MAKRGERSEPKQWKHLKPAVQAMRQKPTLAEEHLWEFLRDRRLDGYKFRRQHAIQWFIVDFYCADARLIIEVDGDIHIANSDSDRAREQILGSLGLKVIRFTNDAVLHNLESVLDSIRAALKNTPPLHRDGEGVGG